MWFVGLMGNKRLFREEHFSDWAYALIPSHRRWVPRLGPWLVSSLSCPHPSPPIQREDRCSFPVASCHLVLTITMERIPIPACVIKLYSSLMEKLFFPPLFENSIKDDSFWLLSTLKCLIWFCNYTRFEIWIFKNSSYSLQVIFFKNIRDFFTGKKK